MITALLVIAVHSASEPAPAPGRYDMAVRLPVLERTWLEAPEARRREAVDQVSQAVTGFFSGQFGRVCEILDRATATLAARELRPDDAVTVRARRPVADVNEPLEIVAYFAYPTRGEVAVSVGEERQSLTSGRAVVLRGSSPIEGGLTSVEVRIADRKVTVPFLRAEGIAEQLRRWAASEDPVVRAIGEELDRIRTNPDQREIEPDYASWWREAADRFARPGPRPGPVPIARYGSTWLRGHIPAEGAGREVLVIALHGAGGSENMFMEGYGAGLALRLAKERGWSFLSPRSGPRAAQDALDYFVTYMGIAPRRLFVMGHSMGGGLTLQSGSLSRKPDAVALFAPAGTGVPPALAEVPMFLAVGAQELAMLRMGAQNLARSQAGRENFEFRTYDPSEHLMIVADALPDAFRFLDRRAN